MKNISILFTGLVTSGLLWAADSHLLGNEANAGRRVGICAEVGEVIARLALQKNGGAKIGADEIKKILNRQLDAGIGKVGSKATPVQSSVPTTRYLADYGKDSADGAVIQAAIKKRVGAGADTAANEAVRSFVEAHHAMTGSIPEGARAQAMADMIAKDTPEILEGKAVILREFTAALDGATSAKGPAQIYEEVLMRHKEIDEALEAAALEANPALKQASRKAELEAAKGKLRKQMIDCGCGPNASACPIVKLPR